MRDPFKRFFRHRFSLVENEQKIVKKLWGFFIWYERKLMEIAVDSLKIQAVKVQISGYLKVLILIFTEGFKNFFRC
jgi:hypothetical protein